MSSQTTVHRTQEQRRAETRRKLLNATVKSVLQVGYANTTTRRVAQLAGVSAGAQAYHFRHRVDLVGAAIEHLAEQRMNDLRELAEPLQGTPEDRIAALLDLLWGDFSSPIFVVFVKLWVAAADEAELYQRLAVAERKIARAVTDLATEAAGDLSATADAEGLVLLMFSACRGLALTHHFEPRTHRRRDQWPTLRAALLKAVPGRDRAF
jgi:AcrR family transcriptional regulator